MGMANVLIVYATREGQTEKIAKRLAEVIRNHDDEVTLVDAKQARDIDPSAFDRVLVGSPIHLRKYAPEIVAFVARHREALEAKKASFFSVNLAIQSHTSDGRAETRAVVDSFVEATKWHPDHVELFAGALPYTKYNFLVRWIMRRISKSEGGDTDTSRDYEYTDWNAVDRFALSDARA
jgi:menaquinone-dependent protoporphyrinogen oxidase